MKPAALPEARGRRLRGGALSGHTGDRLPSLRLANVDANNHLRRRSRSNESSVRLPHRGDSRDHFGRVWHRAVSAVKGTPSSAVIGNASTASALSPSSTLPPTPVAPERQDLRLVGSGFTVYTTSFNSDMRFFYGAVLTNPNADTYIASRVSVNITFASVDGTVAKSLSESISAVLPGQTVALGDDAGELSGKPLTSTHRGLEPQCCG